MHQYTDDFINDLNSVFSEIRKKNPNPIPASCRIVEILEEKIKEMHHWLRKHTFSSTEEEIRFFKEVKPTIVSQLIYHTKVINIEANAPTPKKIKIRFLKKELEKASQYAKKNKNFNHYYRSGSRLNDVAYFTRTQELKLRDDECHLINYDIRVSTSHDYSVAQLLANDLISVYLEEKLEQINSYNPITTTSFTSNLSWTSPKIDFVELIYALQQSKAINWGNVDIKELATCLGKMLNIDIDDSIYRKYQDIKLRKFTKTKFLNTMAESLLQKIDEEDSL